MVYTKYFSVVRAYNIGLMLDDFKFKQTFGLHGL